MRIPAVVPLAFLLAACDVFGPRQVKLVAAYNQTRHAGAAVVPQFGSQYQTGGMEYIGLCLYDSGRYARITHFWSYNTALARADEVQLGDFSRIGADSVVFEGAFPPGRGQVLADALTIDNGNYYFVRSTRVACPARVSR
ncbi:MAG TPA: hypothetical protein VFO55_10840 [Gemmatimonadaceae bacterium]|nr:hypothetical protein [Gemmatimonadaceae bacterium]